MKLNKIGETEVLKQISGMVENSSEILVGIGDDAAVIRQNGDKLLLITTDMLLEDVHFELNSKGFTPEKLGRKALAVNLSDIAAMGGCPKYATVAISIPGKSDTVFLKKIYQGIIKLANEYGVEIIGGDTVSSNKLMISITLVGEVLEKNIVLRSTANPGDKIFITGCLGGSIYDKHFEFSPRLKEACYLTENFNITSMIDISDGLVCDCYRVAQLSKVSFYLYSKNIPLSDQAECLEDGLYDGEDFELLFTVDEKTSEKLKNENKILNNTSLNCIGDVKKGNSEVFLIDKNGSEELLKNKGYDHFPGNR